MELVEVIVYVRDMERAVAFYRDVLGLELDFESPYWTTFQTGACTFALHKSDRRDHGTAEPDPTFRVADVEAERQRLAEAGVEITGIRDPSPGVRVFDAFDPEGNRFSLESATGL